VRVARPERAVLGGNSSNKSTYDLVCCFVVLAFKSLLVSLRSYVLLRLSLYLAVVGRVPRDSSLSISRSISSSFSDSRSAKVTFRLLKVLVVGIVGLTGDLFFDGESSNFDGADLTVYYMTAICEDEASLLLTYVCGVGTKSFWTRGGCCRCCCSGYW